jgi:hypothetical protein
VNQAGNSSAVTAAQPLFYGLLRPRRLRAVSLTPPVNKNEPTSSLCVYRSVADLLRGDYKQSDYGKVILPFTVLRHLDLRVGAHQGSCAIRVGEEETDH